MVLSLVPADSVPQLSVVEPAEEACLTLGEYSRNTTEPWLESSGGNLYKYGNITALLHRLPKYAKGIVFPFGKIQYRAILSGWSMTHKVCWKHNCKVRQAVSVLTTEQALFLGCVSIITL